MRLLAKSNRARRKRPALKSPDWVAPAARDRGSGDRRRLQLVRRFIKMAIPLSLPAILTEVIFTFTLTLQEFVYALTATTRPGMVGQSKRCSAKSRSPVTAGPIGTPKKAKRALRERALRCLSTTSWSRDGARQRDHQYPQRQQRHWSDGFSSQGGAAGTVGQMGQRDVSQIKPQQTEGFNFNRGTVGTGTTAMQPRRCSIAPAITAMR